MTSIRKRPTALRGANLLSEPLFNKGTAFTEEERNSLNLLGLLPPHVDTLETQVARAYKAYCLKQSPIEQHIFLRQLQDENEVLFYRLLLEHVEEMMPIIYTPTVGDACENFSEIYRHHRGLFIAYPQRLEIEKILENYGTSDVDVIVVTDGERILGLGDQGAGGMGIPIGKLSLYTLCGGIDPARTLPILLDSGTNNEERLKDPLYLGWRHERVKDEEYDQFVDSFVQAVKKKLPNVLLQWEDFANQDARRFLEKYRDDLCTFNDDIQGTAAVAVAGVLAAIRASGGNIRDQQIVMFGAGSAGLGIADLLCRAMIEDGASSEEAEAHIWLVDRPGLLHDALSSQEFKLQPAQKRFVKEWSKLQQSSNASNKNVDLLQAVKLARASVMIGTSAQTGAFTEPVIKAMAETCARPVVFPLSNPTSKSEAKPSDVLTWTDGKALVATGSPFAPVELKGKKFVIGQCNNSYIFPGVGLGIVASRAERVTEQMFMAAAKALANESPAIEEHSSSLFPSLTKIRDVSRKIAAAVGASAQSDGVAQVNLIDELHSRIEECMWVPDYAQIVPDEVEDLALNSGTKRQS